MLEKNEDKGCLYCTWVCVGWGGAGRVGVGRGWGHRPQPEITALASTLPLEPPPHPTPSVSPPSPPGVRYLQHSESRDKALIRARPCEGKINYQRR